MMIRIFPDEECYILIDEEKGYVISIADPNVEDASLEFWMVGHRILNMILNGKNPIHMMMKLFRPIILIINYF